MFVSLSLAARHDDHPEQHSAPEDVGGPAEQRGEPVREPEAPDAALPPSALPEVERAYLRVLGIPACTIDSWLRAGVLGPTTRPNVYTRTPEANRRISTYLER